MKKLVLGICAALSTVSVFAVTWRYVPANDPDNQYGGVKYITDGNWAIQVAEWNPNNFKTTKGSGAYLAGSGVMDLTNVNEDVGKPWVFEGGWVSNKYTGPFSRFTTLTEVILPINCTSLCYGMFTGCSNLTKITVPSGYLTSMGAAAVNGCSSLTTVVPESAFSGSCASYGEVCFNGCSSLRIPFK